MSILISPITIDANSYCVDEQGNNRTEVLLLDGATDLGGNIYKLADWGGSVAGGIKFGTICATEVTIGLNSDTAPADMEWEIFLNGVSVASGATSGTELDVSEIVALTPTPCGNIIEVTAAIVDSLGPVVIACAITF